MIAVQAIKALQSRLPGRGVDPGAIDGILGPRCMAAQMAAMVGKRTVTPLMQSVAVAIIKYMPMADISTPLRLCHVLSQAAHETDHWNTLTEYGDVAYFNKYDGRADLGNSQPGDGYRYRGRGLPQLTGRINYVSVSTATGLDLVSDPNRVAEPDTGALVMMTYWRSRQVNVAADSDNCPRVTKLINGGLNGLDSRKALLAAVKVLWGLA